MDKQFDFRTIKSEVHTRVMAGEKVVNACKQVADKYGISENTVRGYYYRKSSPTILPFKPQNNILSDDELNSLFAGFLRLIKKSAVIQAEKAYRGKIDYYITRLNECMMTIAKKDRQLQILTQLNKQLVSTKSQDATTRLRDYLGINKSSDKSG